MAVSDGSIIDILSPLGGKFSLNLNLGGLDEVATVLSYRGPYLYAASANDSKLYHVPTATIVPIGTAGVTDAVVAAKADDSNPDWVGPVYTPPVDFLVEADAAGWEVWDITGAPVSDLTQALAGISSLDYKEGQLHVGTATGVTIYDWATDTTTSYTTLTTPAIVNDTVNDIAATVLSTSIDGVQGLKVPAWAVSTDGGVSVAVDTGDIYDSLQTNNSFAIAFAESRVTYSEGTGRIKYADIPTADGFGPGNTTSQYTSSGVPAIGAKAAEERQIAYTAPNSFATNSDTGVYILDENLVTVSDTPFTNLTTTFNTGPMVNPNGAWANDTDTDPIGLPWSLYEDFNAKNIPRFSDDFNRTDPAPWEATGVGAFSLAGGVFTFQNDGTTQALYSNNVTLTANAWHRLVFDVKAFSNSNNVRVGSAKNGGQYVSENNFPVADGNEVYFFATQADSWVTLATNSTATDAFVSWDNVRIEEVPALDGITPRSSATVLEISDDQKLCVSGEAFAYGAYSFTTSIGVTYISKCIGENQSSTVAELTIGNSPGDNSLGSDNTASATPTDLSVTFVATATTTWLSLKSGNDTNVACFDDVTVQQDPAGTDSVTDNSGQGNDATVLGEAFREELGSSGIYGLRFDEPGGVTGSATAGGQISGWERIDGEWIFRRDETEFRDATDDGATWQINAPENSAYGLLTYSKTPKTKEQQADTASHTAGILDTEPKGETC